MKFGGTSVADAERIKRAAGRVARSREATEAIEMRVRAAKRVSVGRRAGLFRHEARWAFEALFERSCLWLMRTGRSVASSGG